ncbi:hypothetical protein CHS0354_011215 [Potamilus streckersoni]|uniref:peptidylprolyl isomerase n=1 Tax=Potamilus streckersoni TaxID=2493646 RepID=A0AAE0T342_9BIVA|nr:hypothetical protein CHS0354_011215 [Potamilus streckersoni]
MFFSADDDDQDFVTSSGGSKLGSLFGLDKASSQGGNESLTYTAPKQPKKTDVGGQTGGAGSPAVTFAVAVHAYKYVDGKYASQGKLGSAILANHATNDYRILLYVSKAQQVTSAKITKAFNFIIQPNNYASFYDDARQTWSLMFDTEQNVIQFAKQIALAKVNSTGGSLDSLISQDLTLGDGKVLENGDLVEVKYEGCLFTNYTFGQVFDSNISADKLFRFKIGQGKVIKGWDQGMLGMKKGSKRLLVLPPNLGYGAQGTGSKVPPNSTLIFEVEVVRVKLSKSDSESPVPTPIPTPQAVTAPPPSQYEEEEEEDGASTVKSRSKSITEHMAQTAGSDKAKLISRMARMGQPMLPLSGAVPAQPSESEEEDEHTPESPQPMYETPAMHKPEGISKPVPKTAKPKVSHIQTQLPMSTPMGQPMMQTFHMGQNAQMPPSFVQNLPGAQQVALFQPQQSFLQQQQQAALLQQQQMQQGFQNPVSMQSQMYGGSVQQLQQPAVPGAASMTTNQSSDIILLTETRQQNTEVRFSLGKVSDKIDRVMEKLDMIQSYTADSRAHAALTPNMEATVLLHNIQRIVQENDRLKKELLEMSSRVEFQNEKISKLLQQNQSYVEKSHLMLEERNEGFKTTAHQSQARLLQLEQEKVQLATQLNSATSQLSDLLSEINTLKKHELEFKQKLGLTTEDSKRLQEELEMLRAQHQDDESKIADLNKQCREEKQAKKSAENKYSQIQEEMHDLKSANEMLEKNSNEKKRKAGEEKRRLEEELEESKQNFEREIQNLKEKLRKQKSSIDSVSFQQVTQMEEEITREWKEKCDKLLATAQEKNNRVLQEVKEEKAELEKKVQELENKVQQLRSQSGSSDEKLAELQSEVEELAAWKEKYESLKKNASTMKDRYEERLKELEEEKEEVEEEKQDVETERDKLQKQLEHLQNQLQNIQSTPQSATPGNQQAVITEVKKIMNSVYQQLRSEFESDETYTGADVLAAILASIKTTTLSLMNKDNEPPTRNKESEDEDENENEKEEEDSYTEESEDSDEEKDKHDAEKIQEIVTDKSDDEQMDFQENNQIQKEKDSEKLDYQTVPVDKVEEFKSSNQMNISDLRNSVSTDYVHVDEDEEIVNPLTELEVSKVPDTTIPESNTSQEISPESNGSISKPASKIKFDSFSEELDMLTDSSKKEKRSSSHLSPVPILQTDPPPLPDENNSIQNARENSPLFGNDDNVAETLGIKPEKQEKEVNDADKKKTKSKLPSKSDLLGEEDLKPQPPPPLFGDDDDDDELDWLS